MRHARLRLENTLTVIYFPLVDDDGCVPDTFDELSGEWKTELSSETVAEVVYVEEDFGHGCC